MKYIDKQISEELFPNFSSFDRAIKYPYFAPDDSFSFYKGKFVKGIIDSSDLPLNVSREIHQQNRVMAKIKSNSVKKILDRLKTIAGNKEKYAEFYGEYGRLIKEGVYQDFEHKDALTELLRFKSTKDDGLVSLREYAERMREDQKSIYYCDFRMSSC